MTPQKAKYYIFIPNGNHDSHEKAMDCKYHLFSREKEKNKKKKYKRIPSDVGEVYNYS